MLQKEHRKGETKRMICRSPLGNDNVAGVEVGPLQEEDRIGIRKSATGITVVSRVLNLKIQTARVSDRTRVETVGRVMVLKGMIIREMGSKERQGLSLLDEIDIN